MKRLSLASMLLTAVVVASVGFLQPAAIHASGSPAAPGTYDIGGTVYAINWSAGYVIVQTQKGCYQAVYPDSNTAITLNGVAATVADIAVGNRIRSSSSLATGHALSIDLR